jgi:hypothetical protein
MESKFRQAIRTGLICGIVLTVIYLIFSVASLWVSSTPAMKAYTDKVLEPIKDMWKDWPNHVQPMAYPASMPRPPLEYYINIMISFASIGVILIGLLLTGAYVISKGTEVKYSGSDVASIGALSGAAAYIPILLAMTVISLISTILLNQATMTTIMPPGFAAALPFVSVFGTFCCCLPVGIVISIILSAIGALGYALWTNKM